MITGQSVQLSRERSLEGSTVSAAANSGDKLDMRRVELTRDVLVSSERSGDIGLIRKLNGVLFGGRE